MLTTNCNYALNGVHGLMPLEPHTIEAALAELSSELGGAVDMSLEMFVQWFLKIRARALST